MYQQDLDLFLQKYLTNQHTEQEHEQFISVLQRMPLNEVEVLLKKYSLQFETLEYQYWQQHPELVDKIEAKLDSLPQQAPLIETPTRNWATAKRVAVAAAIVLIAAAALVFRNKTSPLPLLVKNKAKPQLILPGTNKAVLTLADGATIVLDDAKKGVISKQGNIAIRKAQNGELVYDSYKAASIEKNARIYFNTIATPKGGQYQVMLPDSSKVWLNAASSIKFPTAFTGHFRDVILTGEAYFEVAKNKAMPFRVAVNDMQVEVLGTHFNIMAYADENSTNTTLLEGSVKVVKGSDSRLIAPGQQAKVRQDNNIKVLNVDATQAIEWKNGNFNFSHEDIKTIMRKVARWYNVDIIYEGAVTKEGFVGVIPRSQNISEVLNALELTGLVHFKVQERRVTVMP